MSKSSTDQCSDAEETHQEWQRLDHLHALIQKRTSRYVEQLAQKTQYLKQYVAVLTAMLDSIGDGLIVADAKGNLALINEAAEKLVGSDIPIRVGDPWSHSNFGLFYGDTVTRIAVDDEPMRKALQGKTVESIYFGRASNFPDGGWFRVHATPVYDKSGTLHGAVAVFQDITDIRKASRQRDALSALITHDLKNHLIGESRLLQLLIGGQFGSLNDQQIDILNRIERDSVRQLQMTKSLVEIFRYEMQSAVLHFVATEIASTVEECAEELLPSTQANGLVLQTDYDQDLPAVSVDVKALRHVLMNILGNAIKFTPQGGCIKIQTRDLNQEISISVSDTGAGMPTADLELLFADVWPGSSGHRALESSGLGLYLCAKIMAAHNGRITCTSELGAGTTFTLFLPKVEAKR